MNVSAAALYGAAIKKQSKDSGIKGTDIGLPDRDVINISLQMFGMLE